MNNLNILHDKLGVYLNKCFNNKNIISHFNNHNLYEYVCLTNLSHDEDEINILKLEKFLKKYKYIFHHGKFISEDKKTIIPCFIVFNIMKDDIEFICNSFDIKDYYKSKITCEGSFFKLEEVKKKFEKKLQKLR